MIRHHRGGELKSSIRNELGDEGAAASVDDVNASGRLGDALIRLAPMIGRGDAEEFFRRIVVDFRFRNISVSMEILSWKKNIGPPCTASTPESPFFQNEDTQTSWMNSGQHCDVSIVVYLGIPSPWKQDHSARQSPYLPRRLPLTNTCSPNHRDPNDERKLWDWDHSANQGLCGHPRAIWSHFQGSRFQSPAERGAYDSTTVVWDTGG